MSRRYVVFDLETIRDTAIAWEPRDDKTFPPPMAHKIVCGAFVNFGIEPLFFSCNVTRSEIDTLELVAKQLRSDPTFVTYNGRGFDFPVLLNRALLHGLSLPNYFERYGPRYRYGSKHIDLLDQLSDLGTAPRASLRTAASAIGMPVKVSAKGSDVEAMMADGKDDLVRAYCMQDAIATAALAIRFLFVTGSCSRAAHDQLAYALAESIRSNKRLAPLREHGFGVLP